VRLEDASQCILVVIGATADGQKQLLAMTDGDRESEQSGQAWLLDLKQRGLTIDPKLAIGDGRAWFLESVASGVWYDARPALLGAQDPERAQQTAAGTAGESEGRPA